MSKERLEEIESIDFTKTRPYRCVDYAKKRVNNINKITECKNIKHELEMLMDELHDIEYQFDLHVRSEEHTSELQSRGHLVCRLLLEKKNYTTAVKGTEVKRREAD